MICEECMLSYPTAYPIPFHPIPSHIWEHIADLPQECWQCMVQKLSHLCPTLSASSPATGRNDSTSLLKVSMSWFCFVKMRIHPSTHLLVLQFMTWWRWHANEKDRDKPEHVLTVCAVHSARVAIPQEVGHGDYNAGVGDVDEADETDQSVQKFLVSLKSAPQRSAATQPSRHTGLLGRLRESLPPRTTAETNSWNVCFGKRRAQKWKHVQHKTNIQTNQLLTN